VRRITILAGRTNRIDIEANLPYASHGDCEGRLKTALTIFMLVLGIAWALFACVAMSSLAGMSTPIRGIGFVAGWAAVFGSSLLQVLGSSLILVRRARRLAPALVLAGSIVITGIVLLDATKVPDDWKHGRLERSALLFELAVIALAAAGTFGAIALFRSRRLDPK